MEPFLKKTANYLYQQYGDNIGDICVVLPNKRACFFLKHYLLQQVEKTIWAPEILSIEDFIEKLSGLKFIDETTLLFEFYDIYKNIKLKDAENFDVFIEWAQTLVNDFNEIDKYLVETKKLFNYIKDNKKIGIWDLQARPLTEAEKKYINFFETFENYYNKLTKKLKEKKQVYQGLAYRTLADKIENISIEWKKIIFIGFNALSKSEEKIIDVLMKNHKAEILLDIDKYYINDKQQEAGRFIRKFKTKWNIDKWEQDNFANNNEPKNINIIGVPQNIGQVKKAGQLLYDYYSKNNKNALKKTALVLADEKLLIPVLNSIPENIEQFNVTMGMPIKHTNIFNLFDAIFTLHENVYKLGKIKNPDNYNFYYKDILKILNHPYFSEIFKTNQVSDNNLIQKIQSSNRIFITNKEIIAHIINIPIADKYKEYLNILTKIFESWQQEPAKAIECLSSVIGFITKQNNNTESGECLTTQATDIEYINNFSEIIMQIKSFLKNYTAIDKIETLHNIFNKTAESSAISFSGKSLADLQIMGMLETRVLDFENVILLSANEKIIPSSKASSSFIPFEIKRVFELPTYKDREAIFAYHFYHLLQRAENIYLIYNADNTENNIFEKGEKSRFITQIINELPKYNPNIKIKQQFLNTPVEDKITSKIEIPKTDDIIEKLKQKACEQGLSPSTLNTFIACSLKFYFHAVAEIKEPEEIEESVDAATFGNVIHKALFDIYKPFINKQITESDITDITNTEIDKATQKSFKEYYKNGDIKHGKNFILKQVANKLIRNFLSKEKDFIKTNKDIKILYLEENFETNLPVNIDSKSTDIKLKGKIDRIDETDNAIRIIDYKTGNTDINELKINDWDDLINNTKLNKSFQLLSYTYLFLKNNPAQAVINNKKTESGIISFRNLKQGLMTLSIPDTDNYINVFEEVLKQLISDIFDTTKPFTQTEKTEDCKYCPFKTICNRT